MITNRVFLSIGSNDQAETNIKKSVIHLRNLVDVIRVSRVYESEAVGGEEGEKTKYLNCAVLIETNMSAERLRFEVLKRIEDSLGRQRETPSNKVSIDLDIVLFNKDQFKLGKRFVPDPNISNYAFLALPLADIDPEYVLPSKGETLGSIAEKFANSDKITLRNDIDLSLVSET